MNPRFLKPRTPIALDAAFDDPEHVRALVRANGPYWPVMRYVAKPEERAAVSRGGVAEMKVLPPWFRGDWAQDGALVEGADVVLHNPRFVAAAKSLFDAEVVVPTLVYVNVMAPLPFSGEGHVDVPAFRGIDRSTYPIWLLQQMARSGLFVDWQIDVATAVSWFYSGDGGAFEFWPGGPQEPPQRVTAPFDNKAVVGDNDFMFHRVRAIGRDAEMVSASLDAELAADPSQPEQWHVTDRGREVARYPEDALRVSVSWKAEVYRDEAAYRRRTEHQDDLTLDAVIDRFVADFAERGIALERPSDPLDDTRFITALAEVYRLPVPVEPS